MGQIDFSPLWVTLKTGIVASVFSFFIGIAFLNNQINEENHFYFETLLFILLKIYFTAVPGPTIIYLRAPFIPPILSKLI